MAIAKVVSTLQWPGNNGGTISAIDTSGANLLIGCMTWSTAFGTTPPTLTDSNSNTWNLRGKVVSPFPGGGTADSFVALFDAVNATAGAGHTFTITGIASFCTLGITAFSGATATPFDQVAGAGIAHIATNVTTLSPGSITPSQNNAMLITFLGNYVNTSAAPNRTLNAGFTVDDEFPRNVTNNNLSAAQGHLIQTSAAAATPTWTWSPALMLSAAIMASYKAPAAAVTSASNFFFAS